MTPETREITFYAMRHEDKLIKFHPEVKGSFSAERVDGVYVLEVPEFKIFGIGDNLDECKKDVADQFVQMWKSYVECDQSELSKDGLKLMYKLQRRMSIKRYTSCERCGGDGKLRAEQLYDKVHPALTGLDATFVCPDCISYRMKAPEAYLFPESFDIESFELKPWYKKFWDKVKNKLRRS